MSVYPRLSLLLGSLVIATLVIVLLANPMPLQADDPLPPIPESGRWAGTTSRNQPMSFIVSNDSSQWLTFTLKTDFRATTCPGSPSVVGEIMVPGPGDIISGTFGRSGSYSFYGWFTATTVATGTYSFVNHSFPVGLPGPPWVCWYSLTQSGTWQAERDIGTRTPTPTITRTPTHTRTSTITRTPTRTQTPTRTGTATSTGTRTATLPPSPTGTRTLSPTPTRTDTATATPSRTLSPTLTATPTETLTPGRYSIFLPIIVSGYPPTATPTPTHTGTATATPNPNQVVSGWASSRPAIDGVLTAGEWAAAGLLEGDWGTAYVLNDAERLYVAFDVTADSQFDSIFDSIGFYLDSGARGALQPGQDPSLGWDNGQPASLGVMAFDAFQPSGCRWTGSVVDGRAATTYAGHRRVEWWAFLSEAQSGPGAVAGLQLVVNGLDAAHDYLALWPVASNGCQPATWGVLTLAGGP